MSLLSWLSDLFQPSSLPHDLPHVHKPGELIGRSTTYGMDIGGSYYAVVHFRCSECGKEYLRRVYEQ